jgi:hypothetical protein
MCTVSLLSTPQGPRLVSNRDEKRTRPRASLPSLRRVGERTLLAPIDPQGLGSWIGANDLGMFVTLLNQTTPREVATVAGEQHAAWPQPAMRSRGELVIGALAQPDLDGVATMLAGLSALEFGPFLLIAVAGAQVLEARRAPSQQAIRVERSPLDAPRVWSSSSLGDHLVVRPRSELFERVVLSSPAPHSQDVFHAHAWPERRAASVLMDREDARTVSTTVCELLGHRVRLRYTDRWYPEAPSVSEHELTLARAAVSSASRDAALHENTLCPPQHRNLPR